MVQEHLLLVRGLLKLPLLSVLVLCFLNTGEYINTVSNLLTLKTTSAGSKVF